MVHPFDLELAHLHEQLIAMGTLCEDAIDFALTGLITGDKDKLGQTLLVDKEIDRKERVIESLCMRLLLHHQPVAWDLRTVSSALKMISDMERIGDQAADIAEIGQHLDLRYLPPEIPLTEMAEAATRMVTHSVDSFVNRDLPLAYRVIAQDHTVDRLFSEIKLQLIDWILRRPSAAHHSLDTLMIAKYLERIGDHAENLAEWVVYSITGHHKQNQPS